ncbi:imelysin family protein [Sorangium cellulosum]|uniref:imelysin family protein n=1 Tax=Sorangium cellulosum TaxID=56 RepID=UPI00101058D4|nr:imelysin family protein [Sorangium cellulosum]
MRPRTNRARNEKAPRRLPAAALLLSLVGVTTAVACRKPPPDEVVYTGQSAGTVGAQPPGTGGTPPSGAGGAPPSGTGGAQSSGAGGAQPPGAGGAAPATGSGATGATTAASTSAATGGAGGGEPGGAQCAPVTAPEGPFTKAGLLTAAADCALNRACEFEARARALHESASALARAPGEPSAAAARDAWRAAIAVWQEAEVFRFGPAASSLQPGGQDLRDQIYSWPLVSRCKIEEQIVSRAYAQPGFSSSLINARGLAALEYLVFYGGSDNACSQFSTINASRTWAALGAGELAQRKADYAAAAAADVLTRAGALARAWAPEAGSFREQLTRAGRGSAVFATEQDALNAVSDAMFYVEKELKDWKLARPLGFTEDCVTPTCPEALESRFALASTSHLRANLRGFRRLFQGCGEGGEGLGFDDWLREVGSADLADRMLEALSGAEAAVEGLDPPLEQALVSDRAKVEAVYYAVKALTDLIKTELVTALNLELPQSSEGDND